MSEVLSGGGHFPYQSMFEDWRDEIEHKIEQMQTESTARNRPQDYSRILQRVHQFKNTIGSVNSVHNLCTRVFQRLEMSQREIYSVNVRADTQSMIRECKAWVCSCDQFANNLTSEFAEYKDVVTPVVYTVSIVSSSMHFCASKVGFIDVVFDSIRSRTSVILSSASSPLSFSSIL